MLFKQLLHYIPMSLSKMSNNIIMTPNDNSNKNLYELLFKTKKNTAKNILIMGSQSSFKFNNYFENAHIDYIDVLNRVPVNFINDKTKIYDINGKKNIELFANDIFDKNIKYDIILDDGIHTEKTVSFYMSHYTDLITEDGIIIIEDVIDWLYSLINNTPEQLKKYIEIYNVLDYKNKLDDVVFVINKSNQEQ
jgi:hypothetical protein